MTKELKTGLIVFFAIIIILLLLSLFLVLLPKENLKKVAKQNSILVAQNEVPTMASVVGERKISKVTSLEKDGMTQYTIQYDAVDSVLKDRESFVQTLKDENYVLMKEQINSPTAGVIQMIKEGVMKGTVIVTEMTWEENQYQISYRVGKGLLQREES